MKTKQRALLALLAAAVLLGAVLWAVTRSNDKAEQAARAAAEGSRLAAVHRAACRLLHDAPGRPVRQPHSQWVRAKKRWWATARSSSSRM